MKHFNSKYFIYKNNQIKLKNKKYGILNHCQFL